MQHFDTWDEGISAVARMRSGVLHVQLRNASARQKKNGHGGAWFQNDAGFDATSYRRLQVDLRVNKGIEHAVWISVATPGGRPEHDLFSDSLRKFGREGEWLKVDLDLESCDADVRAHIGQVTFCMTPASLPRGQEIDMDIRRVVFLR